MSPLALSEQAIQSKAISKAENTLSRCAVQALLNERKILKTILPVQLSNSIFVCCDSSSLGMMKALIFGSEGSPYADGCYVFDI